MNRHTNTKTRRPSRSHGLKVVDGTFAGRLILACILIIAAGLRIWNITWGLPGLYDEAIPLRYAMKLWTISSPHVDYTFFVYPALTYYVHFVAQYIHFLVGYLAGTYAGLRQFQDAFGTDPSSFAVVSRLVSVLFDLGSVLMANVLGNRFAGRRTGLLAAGLVAINFLHVKEAHLINVDTPLTFFALLSVYICYRLYLEGSRRWYLLGGLAIGLATATKYNAAVLLIVLAVGHGLRAESFSKAARGLLSSNLLWSVGTAAAVFVVLNPLILVNLDSFLTKFSALGTLIESRNLGISPGESTLGYYLFDCLPSNLGWILTIAAIVSTGHLAVERKKKNFILLAFPVVFFAAIATWEARAERYILPVVPLLLIITSSGLLRLYDLVRLSVSHGRARDLAARYLPTGGMLVALSINIVPLVSLWKQELAYSLPDTRKATLEWIEGHIAPGSAIALGFIGLEFPADRYITLPIQFSTIGSEQFAPFYDTRWYEDLDLVIASDYDYGRYKMEPSRFARMLAFYDTLRTQWKLVHETVRGSDMVGPTYWMYSCPASIRSSSFPPDLLNQLSTVDDARAVDFLGKLGLILSVKGKLEKSEQVLSRLLIISPHNLEGRNALAEVEYGGGNLAAAISQLDTSLTVNPLQAEIYAFRGKIYYQLKAPSKAERDLTEALKLNDRLEDCYVLLTSIYGERHDVPAIIDILSRYHTILPASSAKAKIVADEIAKLKKLE